MRSTMPVTRIPVLANFAQPGLDRVGCNSTLYTMPFPAGLLKMSCLRGYDRGRIHPLDDAV